MLQKRKQKDYCRVCLQKLIDITNYICTSRSFRLPVRDEGFVGTQEEVLERMHEISK